jgi:hypothetical protein
VGIHLVSDWRAFIDSNVARGLALPIWLALGVAPFVYLLAAFAALQIAFIRINQATKRRISRTRAKFAVTACMGLVPRDTCDFGYYEANETANATSFHDAWARVRSFRTSLAEERRVAESAN